MWLYSLWGLWMEMAFVCNKLMTDCCVQEAAGWPVMRGSQMRGLDVWLNRLHRRKVLATVLPLSYTAITPRQGLALFFQANSLVIMTEMQIFFPTFLSTFLFVSHDAWKCVYITRGRALGGVGLFALVMIRTHPRRNACLNKLANLQYAKPEMV